MVCEDIQRLVTSTSLHYLIYPGIDKKNIKILPLVGGCHFMTDEAIMNGKAGISRNHF